MASSNLDLVRYDGDEVKECPYCGVKINQEDGWKDLEEFMKTHEYIRGIKFKILHTEEERGVIELRCLNYINGKKKSGRGRPRKHKD